jgi:hypothetical protein
MERSKSSPSGRGSAVRSGALTALATVVVSAAAAAVGVVLAQHFGRNADTDGFLAAYGVYLALVIGAPAFRMVVVPDLARAAAAGRLGEETGGYLLALLAVGLPLCALAVAAQGPLGDAITGSLPPRSAQIAGDALAWLVPAAFAQLLAAVAASALAARDSYGVAALAYAVGGAAGVLLFVALLDHGLVALAWGVALNGALTLGIPLAVAWRRGDVAVHWRLPQRLPQMASRLRRLAQGASTPLALQAMYIVGVRFAADLEVGDITSFTYAYLFAGTLVSVTASSLSVVTAAPLTRRGLVGEAAARHVVHAAWASAALIAAAAGAFAVAGESVFGSVLGDAFAGDVGHDLGLLVVWFAPWMLVTVAYSLTLPLVFVVERTGRLVRLALVALALSIPLEWAGRELLGLRGIAIALALATLLVVADMLRAVSPATLTGALRGLAGVGAGVGAAAALGFGAARVVSDGMPGAALGVLLFAVALVVVARGRLRQSWSYLRALD